MTRQYSQNLLIFLFSIFFFGGLSVFFGKELCFDLAHYHYYDPYIFFHPRPNDYWPSSFIHQYLNPTIDFLTYFLIHFLTPMMAEFVLGAIHGLNFLLLFLIANLFIKGKYQFLFSILIAGIGIYGPMALSGLGSFQNDNLISLFVLGSVFFQLKSFDKKINIYHVLFSGLLLGVGIGLKYTAGIFLIGMLFTNLLIPIRFFDRIKILTMFVIGVLTGVLLSGGYWMVHLWQQFHNPVFPFLNHIFSSPFFPSINWRDTHLMPNGILQTLFFPFYFSFNGSLVADAEFTDFRFIMVYVFIMLVFIHIFLDKIRKKNLFSFTIKEIWLLSFFIFSYIVWQYYFSILRYIVALEMLSMLLVFILLEKLIQNPNRHLMLVAILFYTVIFFMTPANMIRARWYDGDFFNVKLPHVVQQTDHALVLIAYTAFVSDLEPRPQSYLIPFFPAQWSFIGVPFFHGRYYFTTEINQEIMARISQHQGPIYLLTSDLKMADFYQTAEQFHLKSKGQCENIYSDRQRITNEDTLMCPVAFTL